MSEKGQVTLVLALGLLIVGIVVIGLYFMIPMIADYFDSQSAALNAEARLINAQAGLEMAHAQAAHIAASDNRADVATYALIFKSSGAVPIAMLLLGFASAVLTELLSGKSWIELFSRK